MTRFVCPICARTEVLAGKTDYAKETLKKAGWRETTKAHPNKRFLVCPKHVEPNSYKLYLDKDNNRVEWDPEEHKLHL